MKRVVLAALGMTLGAAAVAEPPPPPDPELRKVLLEAVRAADSFEHRFEAEVWLADMSDRMARYVPRAMPDTQERLAFLRLLHSEARRANVPPELVLLPAWSPINIYRMSAWSRTIVEVLRENRMPPSRVAPPDRRYGEFVGMPEPTPDEIDIIATHSTTPQKSR